MWLSANNAHRMSQIATRAPSACTAVSLTTNPFSVSAGANETVTTTISNCATIPQLLKLATKTTPPSACGSSTTAKANVPLVPRAQTTLVSTFGAPTCTGTYKVQSTLSTGTTVVGKTTVTYQVT